MAAHHQIIQIGKRKSKGNHREQNFPDSLIVNYDVLAQYTHKCGERGKRGQLIYCGGLPAIPLINCVMYSRILKRTHTMKR